MFGFAKLSALFSLRIVHRCFVHSKVMRDFMPNHVSYYVPNFFLARGHLLARILEDYDFIGQYSAVTAPALGLRHSLVNPVRSPTEVIFFR